MNPDVSTYNYWPRAIYDVVVNGQRSTVNGQRSTVNGQRSTVNGQYAGGAHMTYHPRGAGGSTVCCVKVKQGTISIDYSLGGPAGARTPGERIHATVVSQKLHGDARILTVHAYPNETAAAEVSKEYVDERPAPDEKR